MTTQTSTAHETYYVPEKSKMAVMATIGLVLSIFGAASLMNDMTFGEPGADSNSSLILYAGLFVFGATLFTWFRQAIRENIAGMNSAQLKKSYVLGMGWFIFSEVMFFAAFFGALFYVRNLVGPWLAGEGDGGRMNHLLWEGFQFSWPMMQTPQEAVGGASSGPVEVEPEHAHGRDWRGMLAHSIDLIRMIWGWLLVGVLLSAAITTFLSPDTFAGLSGAGIGLAFGAVSWRALAVLGLTALFAVAPWAFLALKLCGAAYLIWLAVSLWRKNSSMIMRETLFHIGSYPDLVYIKHHVHIVLHAKILF